MSGPRLEGISGGGGADDLCRNGTSAQCVFCEPDKLGQGRLRAPD